MGKKSLQSGGGGGGGGVREGLSGYSKHIFLFFLAQNNTKFLEFLYNSTLFLEYSAF